MAKTARDPSAELAVVSWKHIYVRELVCAWTHDTRSRVLRSTFAGKGRGSDCMPGRYDGVDG